MIGRYGRIAAALVVFCAIAAGGLQATDPQKAVEEINAWYSGELKAARDAGKQPELQKLLAERTDRMKKAAASFKLEDTGADKCLALAQLAQGAQDTKLQLAAALKYLGSSPSDANAKFMAQNLALGAYFAARDAEGLRKLVSEAAPPNPSLSLSFAATVAASYSDLIAEKLGLDAALESIRQAESKIQALPDGATDQQKQSAQSSRMFVYRGKAELLRDAGRREDALKTIEEGIAAIGADSRAASGLKSLRAQMTLVGSVAPELTKDRVQGEFSSLASLRGKVVLLDFTAHW